MGSARLTRRSLIVASATIVAEGALRPYRALARLVTRGPTAALAGLPLAVSGLQAGPGQPTILARHAWAHDACPPRVAPEYGTVELAFVHHTENPDGYGAAEVPAMLRSIYVFHRYTRGWNDIGYNFVIDRFGRIWEARAGGIDEPVVGAQAGGYNAYSTGIAVLGTYSSVDISTPARTALESLLAWKLSLHGAPISGHVTVRVTADGAPYSRFPANTPVSLPRVAGHRDADATECPGDALYGELPSLRRAAAAMLATRPTRATLQLLSPQATGGSSPALAGTLGLLDGAPLAGAQVQVQARTVLQRGQTVLERMLAQASTGPNGQWSLPISLAPAPPATSALRAVFTGGDGVSACVSDPLTLAARVSFSPLPASAPAPEAGVPSGPSGAESPPPAP
jgi:hypothetical protein